MEDMNEIIAESNDETVVQENGLQQNENQDENTVNTENQEQADLEASSNSKKKKRNILIGVGVVVLAIAILLPAYLRRSFFSRLRPKIIAEYPSAVVNLASDGSYMSIDTNPYNKSTDDMTLAQLYLFQDQQEDSINAIEFTNEKLGFSDAVYQEMLTTNALMGRQTAETNKYTVSWDYHPDRGLEVMYKMK